MALTRTKVGLLLSLALSLSTACGDDDDDDDTPGDGGEAGVRDAGNDAGRDGGLDGGRDGGNVDGGGGNIDGGGSDAGSDAATSPLMSFFVTSDTSTTGDLGGLGAADARCLRLASAVGVGGKQWRAYLSVERDPTNGNQPTEARSRIGTGPWYNAKGQLVASDLASLHARSGNADIFLDERGQKISGQWPGSPGPNQHDIFTGTAPDGGVAVGRTCADWTSNDAGLAARVGHSDGLGPGADGGVPFNSWFSSHESQGCDNTAPRGGAGKIYCFAAN